MSELSGGHCMLACYAAKGAAFRLESLCPGVLGFEVGLGFGRVRVRVRVENVGEQPGDLAEIVLPYQTGPFFLKKSISPCMSDW
ncbi:hypothetical protein ACIRYZ_23215 [Kitasatospora sp. NPDC101155]|uniref:hypothetical protein n=1 Tax=Kitasatospora sp. NPDC101155 TaxID=3364097 RepID=UPI0038018B35